MNNAVPHRLLLELLYQRAGRFFFHGITTKLKRSPASMVPENSGPSGNCAQWTHWRTCTSSTESVHALCGHIAKARTAYKELFMLWKDADSDIPNPQAGQGRYAKLR